MPSLLLFQGSKLLDRRLAVILAADVVGYSRLMSEDEAGTLSALKAHRAELIDPKAAQYNGRTIKLMGDGALMEFQSIAEAVAFAVEVQLAMRRRNDGVPEPRQIVFRIGINIGDVIIDGEDIYGDGVNLAARLEGLADPGGIYVRRSVRNQVRDKLDLTFEDRGELKVKNIARPIRVFAVVLDQKSEAFVTPIQTSPVKATPIKPQRRQWQALVLALAVTPVAVAAVVWWKPWSPAVEPAQIERMAFPLPNKPSIAVLPFDNLSDDPEQSYFADGITEDLITDLSKISGLFVIARNSSFAYKGQQLPTRQVAEELGVRYVIEGSVRRAGNQLRINAQLVDAITGGQLWAERYDGQMGDVFAFQDKVTGNIVDALAVSLSNAETTAQSEAATSNTEAYDAFLLGWSHFQRRTPDSFAKAVTNFERAIALDPEYRHAYSAIAAVYSAAVEYNRLGATTLWTRRLGLNTDAAMVEVERNLDAALESPDPLALQVASGRLSFVGQYGDAIAAAERAIKVDPNDPAGHKALARARIFAGGASEAIDEIMVAMRLDPLHSGEYLFWLGLAKFGTDHFEGAVEALEQAVRSNQDDERALIVLASAYGQIGRQTEALSAIEAANRLRIERQQRLQDDGWKAGIDLLLVGTYSLEDLNWWPFKLTADRERLREGLRRAGVPGTGAGENVSPMTIDGATTVDAVMAEALHRNGAIFIDVRGKASWDAGHIPGARHLDLKTRFTETGLTSLVKRNQKLVIYCAGPRCLLSSEACAKAVSWGFEQVFYFREGFPSWKASGYAVEVSSE